MDNDDSSSLYSPSASDDSETDDEYFDHTAPAMEKKYTYFLKVSYINYSKFANIAAVLLILRLKKIREVWLQLLQIV